VFLKKHLALAEECLLKASILAKNHLHKIITFGARFTEQLKFMKKLFFSFFVLSFLSAVASETDTLKTSKQPRKKQVTAEKEAQQNELEKKFNKYSKDRFTIDLLGDNWIYNSNDARMNGLKTKWWSRGINIYFSWDFRIKKSRVSIAPGIGYSASNIYSRHGLVEDSVGTHFSPLTTINPSIAESDYKVNKLTLQYVDIPVELRIRSNPDKFDNMWKVAIGFKAGIRVDAHTKEKTKVGSVAKVDIERRFPDFNLFRFGPTLRVGYSVFNITAYYGVLNVFKKDRGPVANEFSIGISFNGL
jgi:hypothetical protein